MKNSKVKKNQKASSIRVSGTIKEWLDETLKEANKKPDGRKIKLDDLMAILKGKLTSDDIELLRQRSQRGEDRKESMRRFYVETRGQITKDEFADFQMSDDYFAFLSEYRGRSETPNVASVAAAS